MKRPRPTTHGKSKKKLAKAKPDNTADLDAGPSRGTAKQPAKRLKAEPSGGAQPSSASPLAPKGGESSGPILEPAKRLKSKTVDDVQATFTAPSLPKPALERADSEDVLESSDAARVGVQLVVHGNVVGAVMVAGRPTSPFTGTMGDHVTAFGVHVVNLRRAMQGKTTKEARTELTKLVDTMRTLPGFSLTTPGDSDWQRRRAALEAAVLETPGDSDDDRVAALQRIAALYLEVREGIPLSLLNTRSLTADAGKGRGEAIWLASLASGRGAGEPQKKTKRGSTGGDATAEQLAIAKGLFDEDASALLTFNHSIGQRAPVTSLLPAHSNVDAVLRLTTDALIHSMARQHAMSLFPTAGDEVIEGITKAVVGKLGPAHEKRAKADGSEWQRRLGETLNRVSGAAEKQETPGFWLDQYRAGMPTELESALRDVGLLSAGAHEAFRQLLTSLYETVPDAVERANDMAGTPRHPDRSSLVSTVRGFLRTFAKSMETVADTEPAGLSPGALQSIDVALAKLIAATDVASDHQPVAIVAAKDAEQPASEAQPTPALPTKKRSLETVDAVGPAKSSDGGDAEPRRKVVARSVFGTRPIVPPAKATRQEGTGAANVLAELSSGTGNSFTVALRLGPDRRITLAGLRGRTPSPFKGTMGAHATAWVVWVHAIEALVDGTSVQEAGDNLVRFAEGLMIDAEGQPNLANNAQNGQRRADARWGPGSLDAWRALLQTQEAKPWSVSSIQAYAQAVMTFVNMLPGTTRTGKNTDGHAEAKAWSEAKQNFASDDSDTHQAGLAGAGLFDAGTNAWVRPRHLALMGLALGGRESDSWKKWPTRQ